MALHGTCVYLCVLRHIGWTPQAMPAAIRALLRLRSKGKYCASRSWREVTSGSKGSLADWPLAIPSGMASSWVFLTADIASQFLQPHLLVGDLFTGVCHTGVPGIALWHYNIVSLIPVCSQPPELGGVKSNSTEHCHVS